MVYQAKKYTLSLYDTSVLKGVAILMMLFHHLFVYGLSEFHDIYIFGYGIIQTIATSCKACVAIFVFLSGYGLMVKYKDYDKIVLKSFYLNRFIKLMFNYWFVWLLFVPLSSLTFGPSLAEQYGEGHTMLKTISDFLGIADWFGIQPYNFVWWFLSCIIGLYIIFPGLFRLVKTSNVFPLTLSVVIFLLPTNILMSVRWYVASFVCGMVFANNKWSYKAKSYIPGSTWTCLFLLVCLCRLKMGSFVLLYDALIASIAVIVYKSLGQWQYTKKFLSFWGRYSMDIFLTHLFVYATIFHIVKYNEWNFPIVVILLFGLSLLLAIVLNEIKKLIRFNIIVNNLRSKF